MLALLSLLGITSINTAITEVRISTNMMVYHMNFYAAESGLPVGVLHSVDEQQSEDWAGWEDTQLTGGGTLSNKCSYNYTVELDGNEVIGKLSDIMVVSTGTHPRGGEAVVSAIFTAELPEDELPIIPPPPGKILICHVSGNEKTNMLVVNEEGWNGHGDHVGDYAGACQGSYRMLSWQQM